MRLRTQKSIIALLACFIVQLVLLQKTDAAEVCTPPPKPIKYTIRSGEDFYSILKSFALDPVIGAGGSLEQMQQINNLPDQTQAQAGTELLLPFKCEEKLIN